MYDYGQCLVKNTYGLENSCLNQSFLSRPDLREPFYVSIWFGQGVIWVGILCFDFYIFVCLCFGLGVVLNQGQLSIVVSDLESYLGSLSL